jgi:hypothetical protein
MRKFMVLLVIQTSFVLAQRSFEACNPPVEVLKVGTTPDETISQRMKEIFDADQEARLDDYDESEWPEIAKTDYERRVEVMAFIKDGKLATGFDFFYAAFVFQHGNCPEHYELANELAEQAIGLFDEGSDKDNAKWIYAASLDRYLMSMGELQKFGTQYNTTDGCTYFLEPVDPATTDEERAAYNVPSLEDAKRQAEEFSRDCATNSEEN